jgi:hypothetical protein
VRPPSCLRERAPQQPTRVCLSIVVQCVNGVKGLKQESHSQSPLRQRRLSRSELHGAAGIEGDVRVTPHDARHAFASQMADLGLSSFDVAETLGHTSADVTERIYTHASNREEREQRVREAMRGPLADRGPRFDCLASRELPEGFLGQGVR